MPGIIGMKQHISYQMGDGHNVTGEIPVSYDNFVFSDLEENIVFKNATIDEHYSKVMWNSSKFYNGMDKKDYGNILQAIKTIVHCKKRHLKSPVKSQAIAYLHQEMKFSPSTIQKILLLFGVKMQTAAILKCSGRVFAERPTPEWLEQFGGVQ